MTAGLREVIYISAVHPSEEACPAHLGLKALFKLEIASVQLLWTHPSSSAAVMCMLETRHQGQVYSSLSGQRVWSVSTKLGGNGRLSSVFAGT